MSSQGLPELLGGLAQLRSEEKYCDFVIECENAKFSVHRIILCSRSEYFDKACSGQFLVCASKFYFLHSQILGSRGWTAVPRLMSISSQEHSKASIKLRDDDPDNVKRMIDYLYSLRYDVSKSQETSETVEMEKKQPIGVRK